jgi:hypothetical protein
MNGNDNITDREYTKKIPRLKKQALHGHAGAGRSRPITGLSELPEIQKSQHSDVCSVRPACRGPKQGRFWSRADRPRTAYLRAAQAYMLISMPTGTSTIFGVFQVI